MENHQNNIDQKKLEELIEELYTTLDIISPDSTTFLISDGAEQEVEAIDSNYQAGD